MPVQFLPPTKLQLKVLDHFVEEQGFGSGVHKLYRRLKTLFDGLIHPAMDDEGNVAYTKDGDVWEEVNTPKNVTDHSYILDGKKYTYATRQVVRKGKKTIERRKYLPTQLAIQDYLSKNETHQKNRMPYKVCIPENQSEAVIVKFFLVDGIEKRFVVALIKAALPSSGFIWFSPNN